jgi:hypothetical protein
MRRYKCGAENEENCSVGDELCEGGIGALEIRRKSGRGPSTALGVNIGANVAVEYSRGVRENNWSKGRLRCSWPGIFVPARWHLPSYNRRLTLYGKTGECAPATCLIFLEVLLPIQVLGRLLLA